MGVVSMLLLALAFACFVVAALWNPNPPGRPLFGWLGLALWVLADLLTRTMAH